MKVVNWKKDSLRDYQLAGAEWLVDLPPHTRGRLLSDGLGTGKTRTALAAQRLRYERGIMTNPCGLVFTTAISTHDWRREAEKFWPELVVHTMGSDAAYQRVKETDEAFELRKHGKWQAMLRGEMGPALVIASYEMAEKIDAFITPNEILLDSVTIDEAHNMKSAATVRAQVLRSFVARSTQTTLLTGTPIQNRPPDLHNLLDICARNSFGSLWNFGYKYFNVHVGEKGRGKTIGDLLDEAGLEEDIKPFVMGRSAAEVMGQMPVRQRTLKLVDAPGAERISPAKLHHFDKETGIADACRGAMKYKLDAAVQLAQDIDAPVIIYTYRREDAAKLAALLEKSKVKALLATGDTTNVARDKIIERWKAGEATALVCTLDAVKESATLTRAAAMVFVDFSWLPGTMLQCEGRIDPARQPEKERRPVMYYYLCVRNGPDEVVAEALVHKIDQMSGLGTKSGGIADSFGVFLSPLDKRVKAEEVSPAAMLADITSRLVARANRLADLGML